MHKRNHNPRLAKLHHCYSVEDIAKLYDVHKNTVRNWHKDGLLPIDTRRPLLFRGAALAAFLNGRRTRAKRPCGPDRIYCLSCREPKVPLGSMVDFIPMHRDSGNLQGICPTCDRFIYRRASRSNLATVCRSLDVAFPKA